MKKIFFSIIILLVAIISMAYLYFSKLNAENAQTDISLYAAVSNSGLVCSFENDKSIIDILKDQEIFKEVIGEEKFSQLQSLKDHLLSIPALSQLISKQTTYISFIPGKNKETDYLLSTQMGTGDNRNQLLKILKANGILLDSADHLSRLTLPDSSIFYLGTKENLILLSNVAQPVKEVLLKTFNKKDDKFVDYIKSGSKLTKNSLAQLYVNFNILPEILKNIIPGKLIGELAVLDQLDGFASLSYNFSKEKVLFSGTTSLNDPHNYYQMFANMQSQKLTINNILPDNTAHYQILAVDSYSGWRKSLEEWFSYRKEEKKVSGLIESINLKYHLNMEELFPKYFKNQLLTFQLSTGEKVGAINLSNGDKLAQLLIDLSDNYTDEIKQLKERDLLYSYFGLPFKSFEKPYYTITDNYMIFANQPATLETFLNSYRNNKLLINGTSYTNSNNQLPDNASITFYIDHKNSADLFSKNIYLPYYKQLRSENGLRKYETFVYQLSGDHGKFQSNILLSKPSILEKESLILQ